MDTCLVLVVNDAFFFLQHSLPLFGFCFPRIQVLGALFLHWFRFGENLNQEVVTGQANSSNETDLKFEEYEHDRIPILKI
jgi:hypothetical protein